MKLKKFYRELVRRNVIRAVLAYLAVSWVLIEFASVVLPTFEAPEFLLQGLIYLLAIGLFFWIGFAWVYDLTPEGWKKTPQEEDIEEIRAANNRRLNTVIAGAGITAILLLLAGSFWAGSQWGKEDSQSPIPRYRIAVIPFETDSSRQEEIGFYQDGLTQDLIDALSQVQSLMVLNISSSRYFTAGMIPDNSYLATNSENIDYFISGSLEKNDNLLQVIIELRKGLDQSPFWTDTYQSDFAQIKQLWFSITEDIQEVIGIRAGDELSILKEIRSIRPETYELYLKGKYYLNKSTVEEWKQGLVYLQEAIDRNPADPDAYAGMAEGYITWGHSLMPPEDVFPKALTAAKRAIQLDSNSAEGWAALSQYHTYFGWDWDLAEYAFKRADSLNPNMSWNHYHHSWYLALYGKMNQAIEEHKRAQELDPFTPSTTTDLAELYRWVGEYELGLEELEKIDEMSNGRNTRAMIFKGMILEEQGKIEEGLESMREASQINKGWYVFFGPALFRNGKLEEGQNVLNEVMNMPDIPFFNLTLAFMHHAAGDMDKTFEHLDKAKKHAWYPWAIRIYLADETIQQDPRYWVLLEELKLPPPDILEYDPGT